MVILSYENAMKTILVSIGKQNKQTGFISGDDYIRITKTAEYKLTIPNLNGDIKFKSSNEELAEFSSNVFGKELSKSGISHCFKSLMDYYKNLLKEM